MRYSDPEMIRNGLMGRPITRQAENILKMHPVVGDVEQSPDRILAEMLDRGIVTKRSKNYIEAETDTPIGNHAQALEWAKLNKEKLNTLVEA